VQLGSVLDDDHVFALRTGISEFRDRGTGVGKQSLPVPGIYPGTRYDLRAIAWPDLVFVGVDGGIEGGRIDQSFFHEQGFERLGTQGRIGGNDLVVVVVIVILSVHITLRDF
jgi:hypothetical protein